MQITFIAQSGFIIEEGEYRILIDPFVNNPIRPIQINDIPEITHVLITHDHGDHGPDTGAEVAKRDGAALIAVNELGNHLKDVYQLENVFAANIGGFFSVDGIEVKLVQAFHTAGIGVPVGFLIKVGGKTLYHMGDTGYSVEFERLARMYPIDILFIPIGGYYTMDPMEAQFVIEEINPKHVIPMHYNTFDKIAQNGAEFKERVENLTSSEVTLLQPGESVEL